MSKTGLSAIWLDQGKKFEIAELPTIETEPDAINIRVAIRIETEYINYDLAILRSEFNILSFDNEIFISNITITVAHKR